MNPLPEHPRVAQERRQRAHAVVPCGPHSKRYGCTCGQNFTGRTRSEAWRKWSAHATAAKVGDDRG